MAFPKQDPSRLRSAFRWLGVGLAATTMVVLGAARDSYGSKRQMDDVAAVPRGGDVCADGTVDGRDSTPTGAVEESASNEPTDDGEPLQICPEPKRPCPPCVPPAGGIGYSVDRVPPKKEHKPCPGDHVHWLKQNQNPNNCQCFWKRNFQPATCLWQGEQPKLPDGAVAVASDGE